MEEEFVPPQRIGFIGLGNMGAPMAGHLAAAGFQVMAADANPARWSASAARCRASGPHRLRTWVAPAAWSSPCCPTVRPCGRCCSGAEGVAAALAPGAVVLDMSSAEPVGTRALAAQLAEASVSLVDAPVSGGVKRAVEGTLAIMAGGEPAAIARCAAVSWPRSARCSAPAPPDPGMP